MRAFDVVRFLFFDEGAIRRLAAARASVPVGAALVLMTTIAREYDERDLIAEPHLWGVGLGLSLLVAAVLHVLLQLLYRRRWAPAERAGGPEFSVLLAMVWLTAPLGWIYAIPVERWADPLTAAQANIGALMIVAVWRVLLVTRVVGVLTGAGSASAADAVLAPSAALFCVALAAMPGEVLSLMGGARLDPDEAFIAVVKTHGPPLFAFLAAVLGMNLLCKLVDQRGVPERVEPFRATGWHGLPVAFLVCCAGAWVGLAAVHQPHVRRALEANRALASKDPEAAKKSVMTLRLEDWPPRLTPYPDPRSHEALAALTSLLDAGVIDALPSSHWYRQHALDMLARPYFVWSRTWERSPPGNGRAALSFARAMSRSPAARAWLDAHPMLEIRFGDDPNDVAKRALAFLFERQDAKLAELLLSHVSRIDAAACAWSRARFGSPAASADAAASDLESTRSAMRGVLVDLHHRRGVESKPVRAWNTWFSEASDVSEAVSALSALGPFAAFKPKNDSKVRLLRTAGLADGERELAALGIKLPRHSALRTLAWALESGNIMNIAVQNDALDIALDQMRAGQRPDPQILTTRAAQRLEEIRRLRPVVVDSIPLETPGVRELSQAYESALAALERLYSGELTAHPQIERSRAAANAVVDAAVRSQKALLAGLGPGVSVR